MAWMRALRGVRGVATQAARPQTSRDQRFAVYCVSFAAGIGGGCWVTRPRTALPGPEDYAEFSVRGSALLPRDGAAAFDARELAVHRLVQVQAQGDLPTPPSDTLRSRLAIYSYYVKEPALQVERAYTPLAMLARGEASALTFLVKRYTDGEMSRYLHRLRPGASVSLRGPVPTWTLGDAPMPKEIVMVRPCANTACRRHGCEHRTAAAL